MLMCGCVIVSEFHAFLMIISQENVCVEAVGYLLEELRNPETLEAFRKDVETANMFIGSLIFVQEVTSESILVTD